MKKRFLASLFGILVSTLPGMAAPTRITMPAESKSPIAAGVGLPAGQAIFWTSGAVAAPLDQEGKTVHECFGDTYTQGVSALKNTLSASVTVRRMACLNTCPTRNSSKYSPATQPPSHRPARSL